MGELKITNEKLLEDLEKSKSEIEKLNLFVSEASKFMKSTNDLIAEKKQENENNFSMLQSEQNGTPDVIKKEKAEEVEKKWRIKLEKVTRLQKLEKVVLKKNLEREKKKSQEKLEKIKNNL